MTSEERRTAIVKAVLPVFAKWGFANTTTRQLAEAAGVSEALLYKHFPSKESLYAEIKDLGCNGSDPVLEKVASLEPSTSTLVHVVYLLMRSLIMGNGSDPIGSETRFRLVLNSCLEDGAFPRYLFEKHYAQCFARMEQCLEAAAKAGDVVNTPVDARNRLIFAHHLACMIGIMALPEKPNQGMATREELLNQAVWFVLRGMGLTERAIETHYNPKALSLFFGAR